MEPFIRLGDFVDQHAAGNDRALASLEVAVEGHHQRGVAFAGQELETRHLGRGVDRAADDGRPFLDLHVAGRRQPKLGSCRTRQTEAEHLPSRRRLQRRNHRQAEFVPPQTFDEQHESTGAISADRRAAVVEFGVLQAHAADVQRQGVQAVLQDIDGKCAFDFGPLWSNHDGVLGGDDRGRPGGVRFGRRLRLLHQIIVFRAAQQHTFRLLL